MPKKEEQIGITVKKEDNFSEWYTQVIRKADLTDYSSVSGCMVLKPYSYSMWEITQNAVDQEFKKAGIKNCYFPMLIPENLLNKEKTHVKGFSPEVAWVTSAGNTELSERLAIRPTSETIMYDSYSKWIRSWRDLPLRLNQWNNVVRWEFKHPVALLRTREFLWNEGHTVFASKQEAEKEKKQILDIYSNFLKEYMALYGVVGKKTEKEKFAGAEYTYSIELFLPSGKAIQGPDFHHDGQNFAKAFNIKFFNKDGKEEYAWQNTFALTTRMLGVMVAIHGDDKGLVLPPKMAPIKAVIVPILFDKTKEKVLKKAGEIKKELSMFNVELDDRDEYNPGWKFNEWEMKGVPVRIEIGPKDLEKDQVILVRRDNNKKEAVKIKQLNKRINEVFEDIHKNLYRKSKKIFEDNVVKVKNFDEFKKAIKDKKLVLANFCNKAECEGHIKDKTGGATSRVIIKEEKGKCVHCGKEGKFLTYFGKAY
ncbi:proline--tRNA ligase [Candidatus Woesearchaeota archaeon]|nr:proline--tRNA ligase [Candidatus Woesearchaeota archaeon]